MKLNAYAKINISLDVLKKREDGYHEVKMIMQQIDLKDEITLTEIDSGIEIECSDSRVPTDSSNLVYKAYKLISDKFDIGKGIKVRIDKKIPMAAGLAGGSSDCAQTIIGLNEMWDLNLTQEELMDIGVKIGADVPYCIMGGTALAEGIGEELTKLNSFSDKYVLIAKPDIDVSTAYVYNNLDIENIPTHPDTERVIKAIKNDDIYILAENMVNVLETVTIKKYPVINKIKKEMLDRGAIGSIMSGSGPTVFGIFDDYKKGKDCEKFLKNYIDEVFFSKTI
ncbi:4-(cytidine 5'-diphospho)-2-C-methyl-D-erythritol kinase [Clostridium sp. D2Q-11]|uniref:4-diphosphocytidyl-2-C-methyl-D-erythritol kinase n=1 Tax=Anaeromonas frigoriresistens TaxID=2683708 RepID=A0A942UTA6_9FIRM|nr:4-(cytidine 5'-diphospho)-2-C-methyl-D-erythritol kinase [Anaeromonas frigoriresistens]